MALSLDTTQDKMTDGMDDVLPGKAHVVVQEFGEYAAKTGDHTLKLEIVAHDNPDEVGKVHIEYFSQKSTVVWKLRALAVALGLTTMDAMQKAKEAGEQVPIEFQDGVGRQMFVRFAEHEYNGKKSVRLEGNMFHLTSDKCKNYPRNNAMLKRSGVAIDKIPTATAAAPATNGGAAKKPTTTTQQKPAATAAATGGGGDDEDSFGLG